MNGKELRKAIFAAGYKNQLQFSREAGIASTTMSGLVLGRRRITRTYLQRIQRALIKGPRQRAESKTRRKRNAISQ